MSFFQHVNPVPADALLKLIGEFKNDPSPEKIDLGVGVYQDENGRTPIFAAIKEAQEKLLEIEDTKSYLGPMGWPGFGEQIKELILGEGDTSGVADRIAVLPTPGSSGALKIGGTLVANIRPESCVWMSTPTWVNHQPIFSSCHLKTRAYAYYDIENASIKREQMFEDIARAQVGDILVLHGCCHNPTGEDFTEDDWQILTTLINKKGLIPLVDFAYQGLGAGFDQDMAGLRYLLSHVPEAIVTYSFSKNMGLYRERVGGLAVLCDTAARMPVVQSNLTAIARQSYSMPPSYGEALASIVLSDSRLNASWHEELEQMRSRIIGIRADLSAALKHVFNDDRFSYIERQSGMFSMLTLSVEQISILKSEYSIYSAPDGRINLCGLTTPKIARFADTLKSIA